MLDFHSWTEVIRFVDFSCWINKAFPSTECIRYLNITLEKESSWLIWVTFEYNSFLKQLKQFQKMSCTYNQTFRSSWACLNRRYTHCKCFRLCVCVCVCVCMSTYRMCHRSKIIFWVSFDHFWSKYHF